MTAAALQAPRGRAIADVSRLALAVQFTAGLPAGAGAGVAELPLAAVRVRIAEGERMAAAVAAGEPIAGLPHGAGFVAGAETASIGVTDPTRYPHPFGALLVAGAAERTKLRIGTSDNQREREEAQSQ